MIGQKVFKRVHSYSLPATFIFYVALLFFPDHCRAGTVSPPVSPLIFSIEDSINLALQANRDIQNAGLAVRLQKLSLLQTESEFDLKIFPSAEAGLSGDDKTSSEALGTGVNFVKKLRSGTLVSFQPAFLRKEKEYDSRASISFETPLFRGAGETFAADGIREARYSLRTQDRMLYRTRVNIVLNTVHAFYRSLQNKSLVELFEKLVVTMKGHSESARVKERVGVASPVDVFRAEIQLKNAEDGLALAKEAMESSKDTLKTLLSLPLVTDITLVSPLEFVPNQISEPEAIELALGKRIELEQIEDDLENAISVVKVARNNTLPDLSLSMGYTRFNTATVFDRSLGLNKSSWRVQLKSSTDLLRKSEKAAFEKTLIEFERTRTRSSQLEDSIIQGVRAQLRVLKKSREQIDIREKQIIQAMGKLELAQVKFNYGMADNFNMIEAETELQKGRSDLIVATIDYLVGTYDFRAVLGTLIDRK